MMIILKTWACECGYKQNFPQTRENIEIHFKGWGLTANQCPSCKVKEIKELTGADLSKMSRMSQLTDQEIEAQTKQEELSLEEQIVEKKVPKEVPLTSKERQDKVTQRAKDLQKVEDIIFDEE
jgi:hypothetical protein